MVSAGLAAHSIHTLCAEAGQPAPIPHEEPQRPVNYTPHYQDVSAESLAQGGAKSKSGQHVFAVTLVKATCMYGYNAEPEPFLRICLCASPTY
jgi:hypothetical protein